MKALTPIQYQENLQKLVAYIATFNVNEYRSFMDHLETTVCEDGQLSLAHVDDDLEFVLDAIASYSLGHRSLVSFMLYPVIVGNQHKIICFKTIKADLRKAICKRH